MVAMKLIQKASAFQDYGLRLKSISGNDFEFDKLISLAWDV